MAAVILRPGSAGQVTPSELRQWVNQRVGAKFQRVKGLDIVESLPRNVAQKVLKRELRDAYAARLPSKL